MPTYEYVCRDCGEPLEVWQSFHDDSLTECPRCGGALRKKYAATGIVFKGSGWHIKDYAASKKRGDGDTADAASKADGNGSAKGDSTPTDAKKSGDRPSDTSSSGTSSDKKSGAPSPSTTASKPSSPSKGDGSA